MKKVLIGLWAIIAPFLTCYGMNEQYENLQIAPTALVQAITEQTAREYLGQLLVSQQAHEVVHMELMKKIKGLMSDPEIVQHWQQVVESLRGLVHGCIQKLALNKNEATELWQLIELEKEMLNTQGLEQITEEKLAELQFKLVSLALPLKVAATNVGMPSQDDLSLSLAILLVDMVQRALKKFASVDFKAAQQMPHLGNPIVPEKMQREENEAM